MKYLLSTLSLLDLPLLPCTSYHLTTYLSVYSGEQIGVKPSLPLQNTLASLVLTSTRGPSILGSLPVVTLVKAQVESDDGPRVRIPEKALILYSGLIITKAVDCVPRDISNTVNRIFLNTHTGRSCTSSRNHSQIVVAHVCRALHDHWLELG